MSTLSSDEINNLLNAGIQAAKNKRRAEARRLLEQVLEADDANETAWMWFATVVDTPREKRICLENVLDINPNNQRAREALEKLGPSTDAAPSRTDAVAGLAARPTAGAQARPSAQPTYTARVNLPEHAAAAPPRRQTLSPTTMIIVGALAIILIVVGVVLLLGTSSTPPVQPTPNSAQQAGGPGGPVVAAQPTSNQSAPTTIPANATVVPFTPNPSNQVATWTPFPTLTPAPTSTPGPTLPPANSYKLMFVGEGRSAGTKAIYSIDGDGKNEKPVVAGSAAASDVSWSHNGKIAYVSAVDGKQQLFVADADGSNGKAITKFTDSHVWTPAWSPDGKLIAFVTDQPGNKEIFTIAPDGTNSTRLTDNKVEDRDPAWSPDGKSLAFASDPTGKHSLQLFQMTLADKKITQLTQAGGDSYSPAWSPDGKSLAFVSTRDRYPNVYVMVLGDTPTTTLLSYTANSANNVDPIWTPDGRYILFVSSRDNNILNLFLMTPDGKNVQQITSTKNSKDNSYSPRLQVGQ